MSLIVSIVNPLAGAQNDKKAERKVKAVTELSTDGFNAKVYDMSQEAPVYLGDKPAIVDFTATWCGPCQRIAPILEELANEYAGKIVMFDNKQFLQDISEGEEWHKLKEIMRAMSRHSLEGEKNV